MRPALVLIVLDLCCAISPCRAADVLSADSLAIQPGSLRLGVERLRMPAGEEPLALAELAALTDLPWRLYAGPALLGAIAGERGGFFVAGIEGGWRLESRAGPGVDVGILAGGGGGGSAAVGGGLMLRGRVALSWSAGQDRFIAGVARVSFPSGEIRSTDLYVAWERRFRAVSPRDPLAPWEARGSRGLSFSPASIDLVVARHAHPGGLVDTSGRSSLPALDLVGLAAAFGLGGPWLLRAEGSAAHGGRSGGYMEVLVGPVVRLPVGASGLAVTGAVAAGSGGGGGVGTGAGLLASGSAGLELRFARSFRAGVEGGYLAAPSSSFRASTVGLSLGWTCELARIAGDAEPPREDAKLVAVSWRVRPTLQRYASGARTAAGGGATPIEQLAFKADLLLSDFVYLTGQSGWAVRGRAGAWATGLLGAGAESPSWSGHRLAVEALAGAGGGGGIATGGGALLQAAASWSFELTPRVAIQLSAGRTRAVGGRFSSALLEAGLVFRGARLVRSSRDG